VQGKRNPDAAWYYPDPKDAAKESRPHRVLERREGGGVGFPERCGKKNFGTNRRSSVDVRDSLCDVFTHGCAKLSFQFCGIGRRGGVFVAATSLTPSKLRLVEVMKTSSAE